MNWFLWRESLLYDAFLIVGNANNKQTTNAVFSRVKEYLRILFFLILGNYPSTLSLIQHFDSDEFGEW